MSSTRIRIGSEPGCGEAVVFEQFTREFSSILQFSREKQARQVTSGNDVTSARLQIACFGDVAQKLVPIVDRLQASDQLSTLKKTELLLIFGDKFYHIAEFQAASMFFYEKVLILDERSLETPVNNTQTVLERILTTTEQKIRQRSQLEGQTYVRSLFGVAMCCFHNQKNSDGFVKYPGKLEKIIGALTFLRLGMELAVEMERQYSGQFTWLMINGTVLVYSIAKPLQTLGFSKEVVDYVKWSLLVMESSVTLATTTYIMWRLQLGSVICDCYEDLALKEATKAEKHLKSAENCAQYLQQIVQRLRKEEELDLPLPADVQRVLTQAETASAMILSKIKTPTRSTIETTFPAVRDQLCVAIDALEHGRKKNVPVLPSVSSVDEGLELLELVLDIVTPILKQSEEEGSSVDPAVFPLSFHLVVIRHCLQLSKPRDEMPLLIKTAQTRLSSDIILSTDVAMIKCLLGLFEALHELQTSWLAWETLPEEEMSEYRELLPISGKTIPASKFLTRLSKAMQSCVFHGDGAISRSNSDLMSSVALQMYHELAVPMLNELDATEPPQFSKPLVRLTCELLLTIHFTFTAVKFDDLLLHGQVSLRLATLLSIRSKKARRGSQIVRQSIERINARRDELVNFSSHFHALEPATLLSKASFSCAIESSNSTNSRDVGVPGTGSQLGGLTQDLCCVQVDLLLLLYRLELQDATVIDALPLTNSKPGMALKSTVLASTETKLDEECHHNGYAKVLFNIQRLTHPQKSIKERRRLADESFQLLQQMEAQEEKLRSQLKPQELKESVAPAAPVVISRSSSAITVKVVEFHPSLRKKHVQYYMVFAKSVGAGTAVSLNSNQLPGTATPLYPPHLSVTISNLLPNESYVFAVAAFDSKHEVIHSIGDTSEPVVALNPLPVLMCYGYLAKACDDCQLPVRATQAANYLYNAVISHCGRPSWMANPFYRQALRREVVAQYPIPTLNLCIQALLILTHEEFGDLDREGKLVTCFDSDAQALTSTQTKALEDCRKIAIAIEIACATDNLEAIRVLSFKGYRLLLPLLHLKGSCDGLSFAPLVTFYQALHVIPSKYWDIDTRTICARVGFELFRIAQETHGDIGKATLPLLTHQREQVYPEDESLREVVALFQLLSNLRVSSPPPEATVTAVASPRAPVKEKPQSKTPIATPRTTEETQVDASRKLQSLNEILQSSEGDLGKVFRTLEHQSASDHRVVEFAAKVCGVLLAGENGVARIEQFLSSFKVGGAISSQFRATISSLGGDSLLPGVQEAADQEAKASDTCTSEAEADDLYLYRWCGELFFIQSVLLYRKIVKLRDINTVNTGNGPDTDCTYELLHGNSEKVLEAVELFDAPNDENIQENPTDSDQKAEESQLDQLFKEFLDKTTGCCTLFRQANCWQGLQAASQQLWNAIWLLWIAPSQVQTSRLAQLASCVDALLDMMDLAVNEAGDQHSTGQPLALSSVVYAAANALNLDQMWLARLIAYVLRAFCASKDWQSIVQKGSRYYSLCGSSAEGSRFTEQNFPVLIYAQQQIVNHQEALLKTAEQELNTFITAFQEQEAKKKKKKSRLVVEEVLPPEELAFRASKQETELKIQQLASARDLERDKLVELTETFDALSRAVNKSLQALNSCHELVEKYRRLKTQDDAPALRRQILASFSRCVVLARQKRQTRVVCQALQEAGDFHLASGDLAAARKSWLEALDNAYSTLNVEATWREVLTPATDQFLEGSKDKINGDELWIGLQCCSALAKLTLHSSGVNEQQAVDYALMAAAIFTRFYCCSVPHPTKCFLYGSYRILGQFWPGRELLTDPDRVPPFPLGLLFVLLPELLLQYDHQYASTAMPVIAGYEYVAESCLEDGNHVANARRLRVEALVQCGRFHEAFQVLGSLLRSDVELNAVAFYDGKPLLDAINRPALNWLLSLKVEQVPVDLEKSHPQALVVHILASILHLSVALSRHESRYDRDTAIVRSAAKKMAQTLLSLVQPSETVEDSTRTWEEIQVHRVRADFHLQLSYLAFFEGDWSASKASSMDAIAESSLIPVELRLELNQKLKFSLVLSRGTFLAQCRVQFVACCLAQTHYRSALETAQLAIEETRVTGEELLRQQLEMQRLQAAVFLGEREKSERELFALRDDALATHTSASLTYVHMIQTLSSILRSKALVASQAALEEVCEYEEEAKRVLDVLLEHDGWIGVGSALNKRLNLYQPAVPEFVQVHADLAQVLLELPLNLEHENSAVRQERALASIDDSLRALEHTTKRMAATKARVLLLKGVLLARAMRDVSFTSPLLQQRLEDCAEAFTGCIKASIEGGYDRQVVRCALIELVDLFGQKLLPGSEDTHVQAAFHYLTLALEVQKHESVLFDTLELQNGSVSSIEKLPASVCISINEQSETKEDSSNTPPNSKAPDVGSLINFFVRLLRMQHILPVRTAELQDTCALLHYFLVVHHSSYARLACLTDLPPVPSTDPEIRAGLVCALWGQDLAPALTMGSGDSNNSKFTFYFTLGTTKVSITEGSSAAGSDEAMLRMEKFASSPLLSKRCNLDRKSVRHLKAALSSLRTQMEDEDSLLIDRNSFPKILHLALCQVQQLFRLHSSEGDKGRDSGNLQDRFGNPISIECTLELVQRLEDLFSINKGANIADNELCYFLRDLLD
ncbi:hypothetical protein V7S43_002724 [Phytophthora oleae]|uniref:Fibronectin type-III domain-containing protein n=1 Tax=Phytophthora oleae TaxID=2107226 RepID=A0ABD3FYR6_9STRA